MRFAIDTLKANSLVWDGSDMSSVECTTQWMALDRHTTAGWLRSAPPPPARRLMLSTTDNPPSVQTSLLGEIARSLYQCEGVARRYKRTASERQVKRQTVSRARWQSAASISVERWVTQGRERTRRTRTAYQRALYTQVNRLIMIKRSLVADLGPDLSDLHYLLDSEWQTNYSLSTSPTALKNVSPSRPIPADPHE